MFSLLVFVAAALHGLFVFGCRLHVALPELRPRLML